MTCLSVINQSNQLHNACWPEHNKYYNTIEVERIYTKSTIYSSSCTKHSHATILNVLTDYLKCRSSKHPLPRAHNKKGICSKQPCNGTRKQEQLETFWCAVMVQSVTPIQKQNACTVKKPEHVKQWDSSHEGQAVINSAGKKTVSDMNSTGRNPGTHAKILV